MKTIATVLSLLLLATLCAQGAIHDSNGSASDVQAKHKEASNGDTITLPAGTFTWSTPVTISKAIRLQGQGSGRIIGNTKSQVAIGTGSKTFTTTRVIPGIVAGQTLRIAKMPKGSGGIPARENYMEGTVTSYSGTTLVLNVTNIGGSGTWTFWWIATQPATTIIDNYHGNGNTSDPMLRLNCALSGNTELSGIRFLGSPSTSSFIGIFASAYIMPKVLIHDCWFENNGNLTAIYSNTNQGLVWNCSFDDPFTLAASAFSWKEESSASFSSWSTNSTMGAADTNGATNFYVEDCDFHTYLNWGDTDSNSRVVARHNVFDNSGLSSHGADTGPIGLRHVELYDNELIFDNFGCDANTTLNVNWFFWMRGGTGVITDNILPAISSCAWGNKGNILFSVLNIRINTGGYPCWTKYPAPHQLGQGYGPGAVSYSHYSGSNYGRLNYYTYLEPVYIWSNSGTGGNQVGLNAESADPCGNNQLLSNYIQAGRDYKLEPKPGYVKYTYPHPLRSSASPSRQTVGPTPSSQHDLNKRNERKAKKIKTWKWGRAKENSVND